VRQDVHRARAGDDEAGADVDRVEPVSAGIRRVGGQVRAEHHTVGVVRMRPGDVNELDCACGVTLTNGPGWSLDEHLRLHRAEVKYEALLAVAHPDMPLSRTAERSPAARALDAPLAGDRVAARRAVAAVDDAARDRLRAAAHELVVLAGTVGTVGAERRETGRPAEGRPAG
jgi:hypothetical protein